MVRFAILPVLLGLSLTAAAQRAPTCQVTGTIKGLGNQPVVFFYDHDGQPQHDTVRAVHGRFTYAARPSDDQTFNLKLVPGKFTSIWYEPGRVTITGDMANVEQLIITGTPENNLDTQYNQQVSWELEQRAKDHPDSLLALSRLHGQATRRFIQAHPQARTSASLLYQQAKFTNDQPVETYAQLLAGLAPAVRASTQGKAVANRLAVLRNLPQVGRPVPAFTMPDTAGVAVSLAQFRGQYVLLDFWGHWCGPCIRSMPHLKALRTQYGRQLAVVGIGMESPGDKELWLRAIRRHQLSWTQLSELKSDQGVIERYSIEGFPTYLLLDKAGVLLVQGHELGPIEEKLKTLLTSP